MRCSPSAPFFANGHHRLFKLGLLVACLLGALVPSGHAASEAIGCSPGPSTQNISYGTVASCTIEFPYLDESDVFQFPATNGELILLLLVRTGGTGTVCLELENPFGFTEVGPNCTTASTRIEWYLASTGTYSIDVYEFTLENTVDYTLTFERIAPASPAAVGMAFGQARGSEINPASDVDAYTFSGSAGQTVRVSVYHTGGTGTPCLDSRNPAGSAAGPVLFSCNASLVQHTFTLSSSDPYVLFVYSQSYANLVSYSIQVECTAECPVQPPLNLSQCVNPNSLQAAALVDGETLQRFFTVGNEELPNCSLPAPASFSISLNVLNGGGWLTVSPSSGTFFPGAPNAIKATINPVAAGGAGTYQAVIRVAVPSLNVTLKIPVTLTVSSGPQLSLSWTSFAFQTVELTSAPPPHPLLIFNAQPGPIDWEISNAEGGPLPFWLNVSPTSGKAGHFRGEASLVTISVNPAGLTAGTNTNNVYTALLKVSSPNATNSPQFASISFHVVRVTAAPDPLLTAYGLFFEATQGSPAPGPQPIDLSNTGGGLITATLKAETRSGGNWLQLSKTSASTATGPTTINVSVNHAGLLPGRYRGTVTATYTATNSAGAPVSRSPQEIEVTLLVLQPAALLTAQRSDERAVDCPPAEMLLVGATIGNGLNVPVSFPQALLVQVIDNCGHAVTGGTAVAVADGQTIPLTEVGGGLYSSNWTPQKTNASAIVAFSVFHPEFASIQQVFTVSAVTASGGTVLPSLFSQGVVESAGLSQGRPLVPGGIISLFGQNMAPPNTLASASVIPLERTLAQTKVRIGNVDAPLYFVSPGQINAQLPFESVPGESVTIVLNVNGRLTVPQQYQIAPAQPGIFKAAANAAVLDEQFKLVTAQNPARIGKTIQIFAAGLGITDPPVASGAGAPASSTVEIPVSVSIGGVDAQVVYQGLAPGFVGLYRVNAVVPQGAPTGDAVPIVITQNGIPSNPDLPATLPVAH
ncbi:MAG: hypothetical protein HYX73_07745 [Acidobacteria bacterium]|nr:hypothetical protein [Acidobacteriota bacterium]